MSISKSSFASNNLPISPIWGCAPLCSSQKLYGQNINFNYYRHPAYKLPAYRCSQVTLTIFLSDGEIERSLGDENQTEKVQKGDVSIIPAGVIHNANWTQEIEFLLVEIQSQLIYEIAEKIAVLEPIEILPCFASSDALLYGVGLALLGECQHWNSSSIYIQSLLHTAIIHLLRKCSNVATAIPSNLLLGRETTSRQTAYRLEQALEYITCNLDDSLTLEQIAREVGISKYYFCRLFTKSFKITPYRYILQRRVEKAKLLIQQNPELKLVDVALECGFSSQSHFNKQFRNFTGTTPREYSRNIYALL